MQAHTGRAWQEGRPHCHWLPKGSANGSLGGSCLDLQGPLMAPQRTLPCNPKHPCKQWCQGVCCFRSSQLMGVGMVPRRSSKHPIRGDRAWGQGGGGGLDPELALLSTEPARQVRG